MRRSVIVGLLCLASLFAAYVGGLVVVAPRTVNQISVRGGDSVNTSQPGGSLCGGGDEGGGGRPGTPSSNGTKV
jgi:uncharacterized membrane protein YgcG